MNAITEMPAPFVFTDSAAEKAKKLADVLVERKLI